MRDTVAALCLSAALSLTGCAGPSKARLKELLAECRDHNREHVRMLKEYEAKAGEKRDVPPGCKEIKSGCNTCTVCGDMEVCTSIYCGVEQAHGAAEMGLGGW